MKFTHSSVRKILVSFLLVLAAITRLTAQSFTAIDPANALGIWDFNSTAAPTQSADLLTNRLILFEGNTAHSADAAGRSGLAGDHAMNFGTAGGSSARITDAAFMALLNDRNLSGDQLSVVFWQRWDTAIANSSTVSFRAAAADRGLQAHIPWGDETVYFDHSGCCDSPAQRLTLDSSSVPGLDWQQWNHIALIKSGATKQLWINGQLVASQSTGAAALTGDWTEILFGRPPNSPSSPMKGKVDDFAIFSAALEPAHITALAAGTDPFDLVVAPLDRVPSFSSLMPASDSTFHPVNGGLGFTVATVAPNTLAESDIRLYLNGVDISSTLSFGGSPASRTVTSSAVFQPNRYYTVRAEAADQAGRSSTQTWNFDTTDPATTPAHLPLDLPSIATAAPEVIDNNPATFVATANTPNSFLELELNRYVRTSRIDLVAPAGAAFAGILDGARLRVYGLRDQLLYETTVTSVAPGSTFSVFLPPGIDARLFRLDLPAGQTNGLGDNRIALADWRVLGDPSPAIGPLNLAAGATASQSSTTGSNTAALAIDGNASTVSETQNLINSHWLLTLNRAHPVRRVELVAPNSSFSLRLGGLTVRLLDDNSNTLATTTVSHPGASGTWGFDIPPGIAAARYLRVGLENGALNNYGDRVISLAGVTVLTGTNYALGTPAYMVRLGDSLPSPSLANDGNHATFTETTTATVDGYWETDLGQLRALHSVRVVASDSGDHQRRMTHATVRLFDENHNSVFSQHLRGTSAIFDIALPGPVAARYVRIGLENKESTSPGNLEWWLRLREVQAFGLPLTESGIIGLSAIPTQITAGQSSTLTWQVQGLRELSLYPGFGSVGAAVDPQGSGSRVVSPTVTTEYVLVGEDYGGSVIRAATVLVNGQLLPLRISEFTASNKSSLEDGYGQNPDWIELHNPNGTAINLNGYGLSDTAATPLKWLFPAGTIIPANGHLIVFASGNATSLDPASNLHASFSLSSTSESVVLAAPNGNVLDSILNYPAQRDDLAYGRAIDGTLGFLAPTPRAYNLTTPLSGWLQPPVFSHSRGFRDTAFSLTLNQPDPAAELLYSLDGSEPAIPYTGPIAVSRSLSVRAAVRRSGFHAPPSETHTFIFRDSVMSSPLMNPTYTQGPLATRLRDSLTQIPTICLSVPVLPDDYNARPASIEVILPDGSPPLQVNAELTRFGGSYTDFIKKSYRVNFRSEYGAGKLDSPLFRGFDKGMVALDKLDTLDLTAGNHDMVDRGFYMANRFVEDTMLEMGSLNPHGRYVHVYVNGTYWGQYNAHERLDDDSLAGYLGGSDSDYMVVRGNDNLGDNFVNGTPDPEHRAAWETVRANQDSYVAVKNRLDVTHLIDFMLVWFYGDCESEFRCAGPVAPGSGFKFWLADADGFLRTSALTLDRTANSGPGGLFGALVAEDHPDFKILLADRIHRHFFNNGALTPSRNLARLNARMTEVQNSLIAECARWGFRTPTSWESAAQTIRTGLFPLRTSNLFTMLRDRDFYPSIDAPVFGQHGGSVPKGHRLSINASAGTIYYTLDGSDPRLAGGNISPAALTTVATSSTFIPLGSGWRLRDIGSLPAANWFSPSYNDSVWASANAPLGYGNTGETANVSFGPSATAKYPTTYFRKSFNVANPATVTGLTLGLARDDGAVVYLNGTEILRSNMPTGTIGYTTLASSIIAGRDKLTVNNFTIPTNLMVTGNNVIAVEIHQSSVRSNDLRFDLSLNQTSDPSIILNGNTTVKARLLFDGTWSALTAADFQVTHPLATVGPYAMTLWNAVESAGTAPPSMRFFQTDLPDPALSTPMDLPWTLPFNLTTNSRINGLGLSGIGFINTGSTQTIPGAGFVGAAVLALDTSGSQDIRVRWTGGTVLPNTRDCGIRLQYRIGNTTAFLDVPGAGGSPVEYLRNATAGHSAELGPVSLPAAADNQPLVELRWKYYFRSGTSGPRPQLRLDEIQVTAGPVVADSIAIAVAPATAQAGSGTSPVIVQARGRNAVIAETFNGAVTISIVGQPGMLGGTLTRNAFNGVVTFDDLVFPTLGLHTLTATTASLPAVTFPFPTRVAALAGLVIPSYIQGAYPENNLRVPHASLLRIEGLLPSATYRYANQIVTEDDTPETEGAGNMIFATGNTGNFIRSTESPRFLPADRNLRHGEFTTGADGSHTGWFVIEPTSNIRFTPGNTVRPRLLLNDGNGGDVAYHFLTTTPSAEVLAFGTGAAQGSALHGSTATPARNFLVLYADASGLTPPLAATPVETTGAATGSSYAPFYQSQVANQSGRWGTIIPNQLPAGVRRFEQRDRTTGQILSTFTIPEGHALTTGLATGSLSTGISIPAAAGFHRWQALRFSLAEIEGNSVGGFTGDPDLDGQQNLLEYAFGTDPFLARLDGLPASRIEIFNGAPHLVFRYRRLLGTHGLEYREEVSQELVAWANATTAWVGNEESLANSDGLTETVTRRLLVAPGSRFLRIRVQQP